jgi:hypothetical protein
MTDRKDLNYITKLPETKTQIILDQDLNPEQNQPQVGQKSTTEKAKETIANVASATKDTVAPVAYASDKDPEPKTVQVDTTKETRNRETDRIAEDKQKAIGECKLSAN